MNHLITFEHAYLKPVDFVDRQDFDWLIEQNFAAFQIERKQQQWQLKVRHYIGVIGLPSGRQVEILPKLAQSQIQNHAEVTQTRQWVQQMLLDVWPALLPKPLPNLANQQPINHQLPLQQWLQQQFWEGFTQYSPNQQYQRFEQNQNYLQGKLLVKEQLQHNHYQPHKFYHQIENLAVDTASNRLVKTTMGQLIGDTHRLASPAWQAVSIVPEHWYDTTFAQALQELTALPSMLAHRNQQFLSFCYALLTLQQASGQGQCATPTLLINMQFAFEKWIGVKIRQQFANQKFEILEQKTQPLTGDYGLTLKPDIWIKSSDKVIIADVKWKQINDLNAISLADMYQLITYANEFDADEAWLIVPTMDAKRTAQNIELIRPKKASFFLLPFDVTQAKLKINH